jgi:hypothetical protein
VQAISDDWLTAALDHCLPERLCPVCGMAFASHTRLELERCSSAPAQKAKATGQAQQKKKGKGKGKGKGQGAGKGAGGPVVGEGEGKGEGEGGVDRKEHVNSPLTPQLSGRGLGLEPASKTMTI